MTEDGSEKDGLVEELRRMRAERDAAVGMLNDLQLHDYYDKVGWPKVVCGGRRSLKSVIVAAVSKLVR